jgi:Protein of unknown function (DUF3040)
MENDPVLRALEADLERDDPALAALLSDRPRRRFSRAWLLLALLPVGGLFLLPPTTAVGVVALVLVAAAPLAGFLVPWEQGPDVQGPDVAPRPG